MRLIRFGILTSEFFYEPVSIATWQAGKSSEKLKLTRMGRLFLDAGFTTFSTSVAIRAHGGEGGWESGAFFFFFFNFTVSALGRCHSARAKSAVKDYQASRIWGNLGSYSVFWGIESEIGGIMRKDGEILHAKWFVLPNFIRLGITLFKALYPSDTYLEFWYFLE